MGNKGIWILLVIAVILGAVFWSFGGSRIVDEAPYYLKSIVGETAKVTARDIVFEAEVARTEKARAKGLSGREYIAPDKGMLFIFSEADVYPFTMKNTQISLDIVWILDDEIVYIARSVQPEEESINPGVEANYVFETRGSRIRSWQVGDKVDIVFDK